MALVVDASALVLALTGPSGAAGMVRDRLQSEFCHAPHLVDAEVGHALRRMVAADQLTAPDAEAFLAETDSFLDWRHAHGPALRRSAWRLRDNLTFYDALYVALAANLGLALVTSDRRLARAPRLPCDVELVTSG